MSMAAAYATVAARGMYCAPVAVARIITGTGARLPVQKPHCHQAIPAGVADAASYILQSVLTVGTAGGLGIGRPAAGKTGTSDNFDFAAFGGYTPDLAGYVSVFNPAGPVTHPMSGIGACYRVTCDPGGMFGADAPAHTWQMTFLHANLANPAPGFVMADIPGELWSMGTGVNNPSQKKPRGGNGNGGNNPGGGGTGGPPKH
jgi:membrane peptidoglycan carboxypeptidase